MNSAQRDLWRRIQAHRFPEAFATRLAQEQDWTPATVGKAIEEYRRFLFLCTEAGHPCTPSKAVDEVWHTHLVFTRNYWHDLCRDTLGKELHHDPGGGAAGESEKFIDQYGETLASYRRFFGPTPVDLWPQPQGAVELPHHPTKRRAITTVLLLLAGTVMIGAAGGIWVLPVFLGGFVLILFLALRNASSGNKRQDPSGDSSGSGLDGGSSGGDSGHHHHGGGHDAGHSHCGGGSHCGSGGDSGGDGGSGGGSSCGSGCGSGCGGGGD